MYLGKPLYRTALALLVCVLSVGVFTLAHRAKCSQYQSGSAASHYKTVKMSEDRCQKADDLAPATVAVPREIVLDLAPRVFPSPAESDPLPRNCIEYHASLWFRPPPSVRTIAAV